MSLVIKRVHGPWFFESLRGRHSDAEIGQWRNAENIRERIEFLDPDTIRIIKHPVFVGRHSVNHLFIDSLNVSRKHCIINKHLLGHWTVQDLNSTNGTYIERKGGVVRLISGEFEIRSGDIIHLASPDDPLRVSLLIV